MKFQGGQVKLTFNSREKRADSIKFKELIQGDWNFILLSSYCTDYEWLVRQFNGISPNVEINLIEHYDRNSGHAGITRVSTAGIEKTPRTFNIVHPVFPKFPSYGVMHCKLIILASDEFLRLVVSSANLMDYDYEEVQNVVFVQDLPKLSTASLTASNASFLLDCQFYVALNKLLDILGVFNSQKVIMPLDLMQKYDWTGVEAKLVYSIPEYPRTDDPSASGMAMLNRIVKDQYKKFLFGDISIEYQGSSIGAIKREWLDDFGKAATGKLSDHTTYNNKKRTSSEIVDGHDLIDLTCDDSVDFRVIFPTLDTVVDSLVGPEGFGTLFCKSKDFLAPEFPSEIFHDCRTEGPGRCKYAMHSKIMTLSAPDPIYVYCGSHNFTSSAWGKTMKFGTMLMINNFEVGVLIPAAKWMCEYPYLRPAPKYKDSDLPWDQTEYYK